MARILTAVILTIVVPAAAIGATGRSPRHTASLQQCTELTDVAVVPHGFLIRHLNEFVPQEAVRPSADGRFWRCVTGPAGPGTLLVPASEY